MRVRKKEGKRVIKKERRKESNKEKRSKEIQTGRKTDTVPRFQDGAQYQRNEKFF